MIMKECCVECLLGKKLDDYPADAAPEAVSEYRRRLRALVENNTTLSSPEADCEMEKIYESLFGPRVDYGPIKRRFNELLLEREDDMRAGVAAAEDPLKRAIQYAMTGNFIDFAVLDNVDEAELSRLLDESASIDVDAETLARLKRQVRAARRLLFMTDNCGEIVMDKVLVEALGRFNPDMRIAVMVRGEPIVNDATLEDALQVGMDAVADEIIGSGCGCAGNPLHRLSEEARRAIDAADVMIAKGQANYEALTGCGLNIFYIFMCKCQLFMDRFHVPQYTGMLTQEDF